MGFELSIYAPEELAGMYWYLSHICSTHLGHVDRIRTFIVAARKRDLVNTSHGASSSTAKSAAFHKSFRCLERLTTQLIAIDAFAIALHALYVVLARHKVLPSASGTDAYSTDKLRYELRMKPFIPISLPELVPFEDYQREAALEGDPDTEILERASSAIHEARRGWELTLSHGAFIEEPSLPTKMPSISIEKDWQGDVKDAMRACIGTSIAIETLKKAVVDGPPSSEKNPINLQVVIPEIGSKARWHDWWIVPQISHQKVDS